MKVLLSYFFTLSLIFSIGCTSQPSHQGPETAGGNGGNSNLGGSGGEETVEPGNGRNPGGGRNPGREPEPQPVIGGSDGQGGNHTPDPQPNAGGEDGGNPVCANGPREESCNAIDDDCDGFIDEDAFPREQLQCYTGRPGICAEGTRACVDGIEQCVQTTMAVLFEDNNEIDDDCDGQIDECTAGNIEDEICDGIDNNCNGFVDEGLVNACGLCGPLPEESCNGVDNDCDGRIDEGDPVELCLCEGDLCPRPPPGAQRICIQNDCKNIFPNDNCFIRRPGFEDCQGMDGICETEIMHNANHCGICGEQCDNLNPICYRGTCEAFQFAAIELGTRHSCAAQVNRSTPTNGYGRLLCWGDNRRGQLGRTSGSGGRLSFEDHTAPNQLHDLAEGVDILVPQQINRDMPYIDHAYDRQRQVTYPAEGSPQVALGEMHGCIIGTNTYNNEDQISPKVYCWGDNTYGQLGRRLPAGESFSLEPKRIDWPERDSGFEGNVRPIKVTSGEHHSCAVYENTVSSPFHHLVCWGRLDQGQAGIDSRVEYADRIIEQNGIRFSLPIRKETIDENVEGRLTWQTVECGGGMCCRLNAQNEGIECWGQLNLLQRGHENTISPQLIEAVEVEENTSYSLRVTQNSFCLQSKVEGNDPTIHCVGAPATSQAQIDPTGITDFDLGYDFGCTASSELAHCWGRNSGGQVGIPPEQERNDLLQPLPIASGTIQTLFDAGNHNGPIIQLKTGREHACVLYESGRVVCWGDNTHGQLGRPPMGVADREPEPNHIPAEPYWEGW